MIIMDRNNYFTEERIQEMIEWVDELDILNTHQRKNFNVADYLMMKKARTYIKNIIEYFDHEKES